jgi:hypothetical protein
MPQRATAWLCWLPRRSGAGVVIVGASGQTTRTNSRVGVGLNQLDAGCIAASVERPVCSAQASQTAGAPKLPGSSMRVDASSDHRPAGG